MSLAPTHRHAFAAILGLVLFLAGAASAQTLGDINRANGFREALIGIQAGFAAAVDSLPKPLPEPFLEAWTIAAEDAFQADNMLTAIEAHMAGKLSAGELAALAAFYSSPLGKRVTAVEIAASLSKDQAADQAAGERILSELPSSDSARLALYGKIVNDLNIVDVGEAIGLNLTYAMIAGMQAAAGKSLPDEQIAGIVETLAKDIRQQVEQGSMASAAFGYQKLSLDDLRAYSQFLASPAGSRYYELSLLALDDVASKEARAFGHRLFVALGYRKA